jgi:hypothetical protein
VLLATSAADGLERCELRASAPLAARRRAFVDGLEVPAAI